MKAIKISETTMNMIVDGMTAEQKSEMTEVLEVSRSRNTTYYYIPDYYPNEKTPYLHTFLGLIFNRSDLEEKTVYVTPIHETEWFELNYK